MFLPFFRTHRPPVQPEPKQIDDRRLVGLINEARTEEDLNVAIKMARMRRAA